MAAGPNQPEDIGTALADIDRRLRNLETAPRMTNTSQQGGTYRLISPTTEADMMRFGIFGTGGVPFFGLVLYDGDGDSMVMTRDDTTGLIKPEIPYPFRVPAVTAVTSGAFVTLFEWEGRRLYHDTLTMRMVVVTDGATTGQLRIRETVSGAFTDTLNIPAGTNQFAAFDWIHGVEPGDDPGENFSFVVEALRASGAGTFSVRTPIRSSGTCSVFGAPNPQGNPRLI